MPLLVWFPFPPELTLIGAFTHRLAPIILFLNKNDSVRIGQVGFFFSLTALWRGKFSQANLFGC